MMDNGNFMKHAATGLRDYCHVKATAYVQNPPTYVNIPDTTVERWNGDPTTLPDADCYLLNDHTYFHHYEHFKEKPRLVKCNGTFARSMGGWFMWDYTKHGTLYLSSPCDYTLASALPFSIQTLPPLIDIRLLPEPAFSPDTILVGHAPTNDTKGTKEILAALHPYRKRGDITIDMITETPWTEAILRKARCHIFIDQVNDWGAFGINAVESLALGSLVLNSPLHGYTQHHFRKTLLHVFPDDLDNLLSTPLNDLLVPNHYNTDTARQFFDLSTQAPKLVAWVRYVTETLR
jgi:hypothetical protein